MPTGLCALAVMTKAPCAGKVKTRLIPPLSAEEAAALNICFLRDITFSIQQATGLAPAQGIAVYTPVGAEDSYRGILPEDFLLLPQRGEGFGERLLFAVEDLLRLGFASVCLINSDSPTVPSAVFAEAAQILSRHDDVVLGPSEDGGYYLIGLKKLQPRLFEKIDWSTDRVLKQTMDRAAELHVQTHLLPSGFDVDDCATLQRLCETLLSTASDQNAPITKRFLAEVIAREGRGRIWPDK